jgi:hypothetical protein
MQKTFGKALDAKSVKRTKEESVEVSKVKRLLVGMLIVGAITAATATGTFATFNASTSNSATVTSGTLLLGDTANAGTECFSTAAVAGPNTITAGNSNACAVLFTSTLNPNNSTTGFLTLTNEGNFNAATSSLTVSGCTTTTNSVAVGGSSFVGDVGRIPLCDEIQLVIAEVSASNGTTLIGNGCIYGLGSGATPVINCSYDVTKLASGAAGSTALGGFNAGTSRFFVVGANFPNTSDNGYQGQNAALTLTWTLNQ